MRDKLRVLILGDIVGKIGRHTVTAALPELKKEHSPDLVIGNVENLAHGKGITEKTLREMRDAGVDAFTAGDHIWQKQDPETASAAMDVPLALPANHDNTKQEKPWLELSVGGEKIFVLNLLGQVFLPDTGTKNPFATFDTMYEEMGKPPFLIVDLHAEATSEKVAFGYYADGRASIAYGTHTHIPTADSRVLKNGTGYTTDIGMTGSNNDVLGVEKEIIINRFLDVSKDTFQYPETGPAWINALVCDLDAAGRCTAIKHVQKTLIIK